MNKLLFAFVSLILLVGCGEEKQPEGVLQTDNQMTQSPLTTNEQPEAAQTKPTQEDAVTAEKEQQDTQQQQEKVEPNEETDRAPASNSEQAPVAAKDTSLPVIDGTNEQTLTESLDKMIVNMTEEQKETFSEAFLMYAMSQVDMSLNESENQKKMLTALNGKSAQDILDAVDKLKEPRISLPQIEQSATEQSITKQPQNSEQKTTKQPESGDVV